MGACCVVATCVPDPDLAMPSAAGKLRAVGRECEAADTSVKSFQFPRPISVFSLGSASMTTCSMVIIVYMTIIKFSKACSDWIADRFA